MAQGFNGDGYEGNMVWRELLGLKKKHKKKTGGRNWAEKNAPEGDFRDEIGQGDDNVQGWVG